MKRCTVWLYAVSGLVAAVMLGLAVVSAGRQGSWGPIEQIGWLPAVFIAVLPGGRRCQLPRRRGRAAG